MSAIGVGEGEPVLETPPAHPSEIGEAKKASSKIATVLELLARSDGTPVSELIEATGWLPHTIRAAITGLRKKGHSVQRIKRDGVTYYRLGAA